MKRAQTVAKTGRRMKKSTNKDGFHLGLKWIGAVHVVDRHYRAAVPLLSPATCSVTAMPSCKNCVPDTMTWSPGFKPSSTAKSYPEHRYDDVVPRLQAFKHREVVPQGLAELQRFLPCHCSFRLLHGNECKKLSIDALHRKHGNHRAFVCAPGNLRAYLLRDAQFAR